MSRQIGLDNIWLRPSPRPAHTDYSLHYHKELLKQVTGLDLDKKEEAERCYQKFYEAWDFDFLWCTHDGPMNWAERGRCTDMGHAVYAADGSDQHSPKTCPFTDPEEVFDFDPVKEYGLTDFPELVRFYEDYYQKTQAAFPHQVCAGGYYKTMISGALQTFGWDMLLLAAADEKRFAEVLRRFGEYSLHHARAWADTSVEVYIQHDDMVWTEGPFMNPDFYRGVIFPIFKKLWEPLKKKGKKILFCADGTYDMFMEDLAACGADGFIFEPTNNLDEVVRKFGRTHCIVGSKVDCRTMAFKEWPEVRREIDETLRLARDCAGFIFAVGNHIPANVSDEMCTNYINHLKANWYRH